MQNIYKNICNCKNMSYLYIIKLKHLGIMSLTTVTRTELKKLKAIDFKEGDLIDVLDKNGDVVYTIHISYGDYKRPSFKTTVTDKDYNLLECTAGTKGGWPYYIADFIHAD